MNKQIKRLSTVASNGTLQLIVPAFGLLLSYLVVNYFSAEWWGRITCMQLFLTLSATVMAWGNKEYLVREFSNKTTEINQLFFSSIFTRLPLLFGCAVTALLFFNGSNYWFVILWLILRFFNHSFETIVLFEKRFLSALFIEIFANVLGLGWLFLNNNAIQFNEVLLAISSIQGIKMMLLTLLVMKRIKLPKEVSFNWLQITNATHFMFLGFLGQLFSKTDLICASFLMNDSEVGQYQIIITLLFLLQSGANMIMVPFLKNYYRLNKQATKKINALFIKIGLVISPIGVGFMAVILQFFYHIPFTFTMFISSTAFSLAAYFSVTQVYELFKKNQSQKVLYINLLGIPLLMACYFILQIISTPSLQSFLLLSSLNQLILAFIYTKTNSLSKYVQKIENN